MKFSIFSAAIYLFLNLNFQIDSKMVRCTYKEHQSVQYQLLNHNRSHSLVHHVKIHEHPQPCLNCESYASFSSINDEDILKMVDCASIDLTGNGIDEINFRFGAEFAGLKELILNHNNLQKFPRNFLKNLTSLRRFSASWNYLEVLDEDLFIANSKLRFVDLSGNKLWKISPRIFDNAQKLKRVNFCGNLCVDLAVPTVEVDDLIEDIKENCDEEKNMMEFVKSVVKSENGEIVVSLVNF